MLFSSNLNFSSLDEAYNITNESVIKQQNEVNKIKQTILYNTQNTQNIPQQNQNIPQQNQNIPQQNQNIPQQNQPPNLPIQNQQNQNIPQPNQNQPPNPAENKSTFSEVKEEEESIEKLFLKIIKNPKFDDLFIKYVSIVKPNLLNEKYTNGMKVNGQQTKENFGNDNGNQNNVVNVVNVVNNYIIFFIISVFIYLILYLLFKK